MPVNTTFLFGAGADTDYCQDMPSGQSFAKASFDLLQLGRFSCDRSNAMDGRSE